MKTHELLEAKVIPDWVRQEELELRTILKRFGFTIRKKPFVYKNRWTFGGPVVDINSSDMSVSAEKRLAVLRRALSQRLFDMKEEGREVVLYKPQRYGYITLNNMTIYGAVDFLPKHIYQGDTLSAVENLMKDHLFINRISGGGSSITLQYGLSEPVQKDEPKTERPKVIRVVKGAK